MKGPGSGSFTGSSTGAAGLVCYHRSGSVPARFVRLLKIDPIVNVMESVSMMRR